MNHLICGCQHHLSAAAAVLHAGGGVHPRSRTPRSAAADVVGTAAAPRSPGRVQRDGAARARGHGLAPQVFGDADVGAGSGLSYEPVVGVGASWYPS